MHEHHHHTGTDPSHAHGHAHHHHFEGRNIAVAFWLNSAFAVIEIIGGILTNSVAVLSDALHDLGDSLALGSAWYFERKAGQARDETYTYGYKRFSLLGAMINAVVLTVGSVLIIIESVGRLLSPVQPDTGGMMIMAFLGIAVNGVALLRLRRGTSVSSKMISLHFLEDVLGWVAVLAGSVVMRFTDAPWIDPLLSLGIAVFIVVNVCRNMRGALQIILQGVPFNISEDRVRRALSSFPEIDSVHDLHLWTLDGRYNILTVHLVVNQAMDFTAVETLKQRVKTRLRDEHVDHATIEFELKGFDCGQRA